MDRRSILKSLFLGRPTSAAPSVSEPATAIPVTDDMNISSKRWHVLSVENSKQELSPGKLVMNWKIENGYLVCMADLTETTVILSDYRLSSEGRSFTAEMVFTFCNDLAGHVGFRFLPTGDGSDAATHMDAGITRGGSLYIGVDEGPRVLKEEILKQPLRLALSVISQSAGGCFAKLRALDPSGNTLATLSSTKHASSVWQGTIGILSHFTGAAPNEAKPFVVINQYKLDGEKLIKVKIQDEPTII